MDCIFSLEKRKLTGGSVVLHYLEGGYRDNGARLFSELHSDRMRGKSHRVE